MSKKHVPTAPWPAEAVLARLRDGVGRPATMRELIRMLEVRPDDRSAFRRRIRKLVETGQMIRIRGNRYGLADRMNLVAGRLQVNPRGFGFVTPETQAERTGDDIYVAGVNLHQAMHGDRVAVRVEESRGRIEGRIVRGLERANHDLVGRYEVDKSGVGFVVPFDARVVLDVQIPVDAEGGAGSGQMVVVQIDRWPTGTRSAIGHIVEVLGALDDPGVDNALIIRKYRIPDAHDADAVAEAEHLGDVVAPADVSGRTDFRGTTTVTIDGETARDFDDAITLETLPNGSHRLGVHIADVAHYVREPSRSKRKL